MSVARTSLSVGVAAAVFATFSWALNFIMPYVLGGYSAYDFISLRFLFSGLLGASFVIYYREQASHLSIKQVGLALGLGILGYLGYIGCIFGGVYYAGPVVMPAFVGLVPIFIVVLGNRAQQALPWDKLALPIGLATAGLIIVNSTEFARALHQSGKTLAIGVAFSIGAVALWLIFSLLNQRAFADSRPIHSGAWTGLMMLGAGSAIVLLLPLGNSAGLYRFPALGFGWKQAGQVYLWTFLLASLASMGGAWAWNIATSRLPMVLTGQLISLETLFATALGLIAQHRLPSFSEILGITMLVAGAVLAVRIVLSQPDRDTLKASEATVGKIGRSGPALHAPPPHQARSRRTKALREWK
jgi:drug/metabolite transporter (DMT)-like permease